MNNFLKRDNFLIISLIFLWNLLSKSYYLNFNDIAMDEPFTLFHSQQSISHILDLLKDENNPPIHFILVHYWIKIFGFTTFSVRFSSVLFSSLCAVIIFLIGKNYFSKSAGFFSSIIFSFSTLNIYFSHEVRVYSLFCLLYSLSLFLYLKIILSDSDNRIIFFLFLVNYLLLYSHYLGFWVIVVEASSLLFVSNKQTIKKILLMFLALGISFIPIFFIFFKRLETTSQQGTWVSRPIYSHLYGNLNYFLNDRITTFIVLLFLFAIFIKLIKNKKFTLTFYNLSKNKLFLILLIWFFVPYLFSFIVSFKISIFTNRYLIFTSIPFYLLVSVLFFELIKNKQLYYSVLASITLVMFAFVNFNPSNDRKILEMVTYVKSIKDIDSYIYISPDYSVLSFLYHYDFTLFRDYSNLTENLAKEKIIPIYDGNSFKKDTSKKQLIFIQSDSEYQDPQNAIFNIIQSEYGNYKSVRKFPEIYKVFVFGF